MRTLIVGGGPAGGMAALCLARAGQSPIVFERAQADHVPVCGGFVGGDAIALIERHIGPVDGFGAQPVSQVRIMTERPLTVQLPFRAAGLSRQRFDQALRMEAMRAGAEIRYGAHVREIDTGAGRIRVADETVTGDRIVLASGKQDVRGVRRDVGSRALAVGWRAGGRMTGQSLAQLAGTIELYLFRDGYAGVLLDGPEQANMALSVSEARSREAGSKDALIAALASENALFGERLSAGVEWHDWVASARVPYGWRATGSTTNLLRAGDQAAVIASLCGDGIAIALSSGLAAARAVLRDKGAEAFQAGVRRETARPVIAGEALRWVAENAAPRRVALAAGRAMPALVRRAASFTRIG